MQPRGGKTGPQPLRQVARRPAPRRGLRSGDVLRSFHRLPGSSVRRAFFRPQLPATPSGRRSGNDTRRQPPPRGASVINRAAILATALVGGLSVGAAQAATIYDWTVTETQKFGSVPAGTLTGALTVDAGVITVITGSGTLGTISGLLPVNTLGLNDNLFPLTLRGVAFAIGGVAFSLYVGLSSPFVLIDQNFTTVSYGTFTATARAAAAVPVPMSLALFGLGLAGLAAMRRARA